MERQGPRFSGSRFAKWVGRRLSSPLSARPGAYVFEAPPFQPNQLVRNRKSGARISYRVRDKNDLAIAEQIFKAEDYAIDDFRRAWDISERYKAILAAGKTPLILDCGANIGLAALYFRDQFPDARIVAVEPDPSNFALMKENTASADAVCVHAAVASTPRRGKMIDPGQGGCGMRVENDPGGAIEFVTIDGLMEKYGERAAPFILKADIEGFEEDLFSGSTDWLDAFYVAVIELHDWMLPRSGSSRPFLSAVAPLDRDFLFRRENVFSISNRKPDEDF